MQLIIANSWHGVASANLIRFYQGPAGERQGRWNQILNPDYDKCLADMQLACMLIPTTEREGDSDKI